MKHIVTLEVSRGKDDLYEITATRTDGGDTYALKAIELPLSVVPAAVKELILSAEKTIALKEEAA